MNDDDIEPAGSEAADLMGLVKILKPLRQHRQASAERRQQDLQTQVGRAERELDRARDGLASERSRQRLARAELTQANSLRSLDRAAIEAWQANEREMLSHLADLQDSLLATQDRLTQRVTDLDSALLDTKQCQRAVEKLGCLLEILE